MDLGLTGRTALVLGATSGLGRATAEALGAEGARVVVVGRRAELVDEVVAGLPDGHGIVADLTEPEAPARIVAQAREAVGDVDVLVLNGGGPPPGTAEALDVDAVGRAVDLLVRPHVALVRELLPAMLERGWGRVLAIGSSGVQAPLPNLTSSNVGRAALAGYLKTLAGEVAGRGVTVNMVLPGRIATDRIDQLDRAAAERTGRPVDDVKESSAAAIPVGRYGDPAEFGAVVTFLAGVPAAYVTGEQVRVDGGLVGHH
jgi:3-oxoacyl-[acyl-carrier protein] reductase